jgi:SNF2 family DNA or RNA helicase
LGIQLITDVPSEGNGFKGTWWSEVEIHGQKHRLTNDELLRGHIYDDGDWFSLDPSDAEEIKEFRDECGLSGDGRMTLGAYLKVIGGRAQRGIKILPAPQREADTATEITCGGRDIFPGLKADLYPYQKSGVHWLTGIAGESLGGILGDEMGLGKTLQIITLFLSEVQEGRKQHLVVAPVTLLENWRREIVRFAPSIVPLVHQGRLRTGFPKDLRGADVILASYDTVIRDAAMFQMIEWGVVVLDEAQAIKNPKAQRSQSVKQLTRRVGIAVTGTPVENRLLDLWSIMDFAVPGHLGAEADFVSRFVDSVDDAASLEPLVTPLMLRRRVADVAKDLPSRIDIPQFLSLSDEEGELYEAIRLRTIEEFGQAAALVNLTRLRMFCAHPRLCEDGRDFPVMSSAKLTRLLEILEEVFERGEKALVFTTYTEMADLIAKTIQDRFGVIAETLDGRRPVADRQPLIDRFGSTRELSCLVLNPRAAGAGLNITSANHVIHYNPEWNPATEDQATARSYRRGQTKPVTVHQLILGGTVEEAILDRLARKRLLAETAVVGGAGDALDHADIVKALSMSPLRGHQSI